MVSSFLSPMKLVHGPVSAVMPTDATRSCAEPNQQRSQSAKCNPVSVAVLRCCSTDVTADVVTGDTEESHGDDPSYEGADCREGGEEGHEDCACAMVASATQAKEDRKTCKSSGDGVQNKDETQTMQDARIEFIIVKPQTIRGESVADGCL